MAFRESSTYRIDEYGGSSRGLKVWFRLNGMEIDPDILKLQAEIARIKQTIRFLEDEDVEHSEFKRIFDREEYYDESFTRS